MSIPNNAQIPICDLHCDTAAEILAGNNLTSDRPQVNLPRLKQAKVGIQIFACFISSTIPPNLRFQHALKMISALKNELCHYPDSIDICTDSQQLQAALAAGKIAAILAVENGEAIENDLTNLHQLYDLGVRCMTIIHSHSSQWAISSTDSQPAFNGLSSFGEDVIREMNALGMIIDISHAHPLTVSRVLSISQHPIIASHSCAAALCPIPRNLTDEQIQDLAAAGGMVGINFFPGFLDYAYYQLMVERGGDLFASFDELEKQAGNDPIALAECMHRYSQQFQRMMADQQVTADRIIEHIQHIIQLVGADHVGFGSDFDGVPATPIGIPNCLGFQLLRQKFAAAHYPMPTIEKICYKNFLRIFESVCHS
ncbi:MAG: dipeptidase [candidate division KSB1 bacterium]|nr:dipeptidase [candidate division KSB1 bacterium]